MMACMLSRSLTPILENHHIMNFSTCLFVCLLATSVPTGTSPPPDRALHWLLLFPPSPYRSPAPHPPLCGRQTAHRPPGGPAFSRLAYGQSGPTRALERPHRGSTPTSDFCGTYVGPPQRIPTPKNPVPAPPSFKCRGLVFCNQRTSDLLRIVFDVWLRSDSSSCVLFDDPTRGTHKGRCLVNARRPCRDQGHRHGTSGHGTQQSTTDMALPPPELGPPGRIHFTCRQPNPPPSPIHVVPRVEEEVVVRSAGGPPWTVATKNSSGEKEPNQIAPAF